MRETLYMPVSMLLMKVREDYCCLLVLAPLWFVWLVRSSHRPNASLAWWGEEMTVKGVVLLKVMCRHHRERGRGGGDGRHSI